MKAYHILMLMIWTGIIIPFACKLWEKPTFDRWVIVIGLSMFITNHIRQLL
jgi:hypothetical protein